ncbi:MAG: ArsR family transcriptional regulator [bacterium]
MVRKRRPELQTALQRLGAKRVEAVLVSLLAQEGELGTRQIVETSGLRQPEVSVGMRDLRRRGWVEADAIAGHGKGRPMHRYHLAVSPAVLRRHYEEQGKRTVADFEQALRLVRKSLS